MSGDEGFLQRWSRRKAQRDVPAAPQDEAPPPPAVVPAAAVVPTSVAGVPAAATASQAAPAPAAPPLPTLDDVARLTRDSDYSPFVAPSVEPQVRNAAMKKLFSDPHFNVMDGLDTYIDDYGKPDPLPLSMLRQMAGARALGLFADEAKAQPVPAPQPAPTLQAHAAADAAVAPAQASPDGAAAPVLAESKIDEAPAPHEDTDLRLQPDDAPGRAGVDPGTRHPG